MPFSFKRFWGVLRSSHILNDDTAISLWCYGCRASAPIIKLPSYRRLCRNKCSIEILTCVLNISISIQILIHQIKWWSLSLVSSGQILRLSKIKPTRPRTQARPIVKTFSQLHLRLLAEGCNFQSRQNDHHTSLSYSREDEESYIESGSRQKSVGNRQQSNLCTWWYLQWSISWRVHASTGAPGQSQRRQFDVLLVNVVVGTSLPSQPFRVRHRSFIASCPAHAAVPL